MISFISGIVVGLFVADWFRLRYKAYKDSKIAKMEYRLNRGGMRYEMPRVKKPVTKKEK